LEKLSMAARTRRTGKRRLRGMELVQVRMWKQRINRPSIRIPRRSTISIREINQRRKFRPRRQLHHKKERLSPQMAKRWASIREIKIRRPQRTILHFWARTTWVELVCKKLLMKWMSRSKKDLTSRTNSTRCRQETEARRWKEWGVILLTKIRRRRRGNIHLMRKSWVSR
jgi:hypothetical protein